MSTLVASNPCPSLPGSYLSPQWYVVYACVRHEKRVAAQLSGRGIEHWLPLYRARHRWNKRYAEVELPLFPAYMFVRIPLSERLRVLTVPGVVHLVGSGNGPTPMQAGELERLRESLAIRRAEPHPYMRAGNRVRVRSGPLQGLEGVIVRNRGDWRLVVSVDSIAQSIALEVDAADVTLAV